MRRRISVLLAMAVVSVMMANPALAVGEARCGIGATQSYFATESEPGDVGTAASGGAGESQGIGEISEAASACGQDARP
jgi:hypothetical protein